MKHSDSSTTVFIRRRIHHWRTTAAGIAVILCPILVKVFPAYSETILSVGLALTGAGHLLGADARNVQDGIQIKK